MTAQRSADYKPIRLQVGLHLPRREDLMWAPKGQGLTENARPEK